MTLYLYTITLKATYVSNSIFGEQSKALQPLEYHKTDRKMHEILVRSHIQLCYSGKSDSTPLPFMHMFNKLSMLRVLGWHSRRTPTTAET